MNGRMVMREMEHVEFELLSLVAGSTVVSTFFVPLSQGREVLRLCDVNLSLDKGDLFWDRS